MLRFRVGLDVDALGVSFNLLEGDGLSSSPVSSISIILGVMTGVVCLNCKRKNKIRKTISILIFFVP